MTIRGRGLRKIPWELRYQKGAIAASWLRRFAIKVTHTHCNVEFLGPVYLGPGFSLMIPGTGSLIVGSGVQFRRGFVCEIGGDGRVEIGDRCVFTSHALLQCSTSIVIEDDCSFGQSLQIVDGNHRYDDPTRLMMEQGYDYRPIHIGRGATVLSKVTIVASIGPGAVIGAGSTVVRDIPEHCLAVGSPAKPIRHFGVDA